MLDASDSTNLYFTNMICIVVKCKLVRKIAVVMKDHAYINSC